ncbi:hypothetical protein [Hyphococcus sp.]|uniref:hypothetical protein n=1 Tax=Hyphococcus sp. TaxID=2038636 RepID=UPI0020844C0D|nr:MAG: hypothetical protein DHS20C04_17110 [Marinicaulis sp.]
MTKGSLPDGVPSDNRSGFGKTDTASFDGASAHSRPPARPQNGKAGSGVTFAAPDMAVPNFIDPADEPAAKSKPDALHVFPDENNAHTRFSRVVLEVEEDDDEDDDEDEKKSNGVLAHGPHLPAPMLILIAIGLLLAALGAYVTSQSQDPQPYCSQQPAWNQYNCQAD